MRHATERHRYSDPRTIEENLRFVARRNGISIGELATYLGLSRTALYDRFSGEIEWRLGELEVLARRLGVPMEQLFAQHFVRSVTGRVADVTAAAA